MELRNRLILTQPGMSLRACGNSGLCFTNLYRNRRRLESAGKLRTLEM